MLHKKNHLFLNVIRFWSDFIFRLRIQIQIRNESKCIKKRFLKVITFFKDTNQNKHKN